MTGRGNSRRANDGTTVTNPDIDAAEAEKLKEIAEGNMQALLKHIDRKQTAQGHAYFAETVEEEIPEQVKIVSQQPRSFCSLFLTLIIGRLVDQIRPLPRSAYG